MTDLTELAAGSNDPLQPLDDIDRLAETGSKKNRAKVGSARPSSLLYTYGPGSVMDLPQFTIMVAGLDDWERIWNRRDGVQVIQAPRLLDAVRIMLKADVAELRPFPWQEKKHTMSKEGADLGVPARIFPQWLRCKGCDLLGPLPLFEYGNTHPFRTDEAGFEHVQCYGRIKGQRRLRRSQAVPARYLLSCEDGHLEEFPYDWWVHKGDRCPDVESPRLKMIDHQAGRGASAVIRCESCGAKRPMNEAQGEVGRSKLPQCRGRHPHLDGYQRGGCRKPARLMLVGASNLWFPATQSIIVMPQSKAENDHDLADRLKHLVGDDLADFSEMPHLLRNSFRDRLPEIADLDDVELRQLIDAALQPPDTDDEREAKHREWSPVDLLVPEWRYLQRSPSGPQHDDPSGLTLTQRERGTGLVPEITRVLAVEKLRKVNALLGFTRVDEIERVNDLGARLVPLTIDNKPKWVVATEDHGEGIFLQLAEDRVSAWEQRVVNSRLWAAHQAAHRQNFANRFSETAKKIKPNDRLLPPRYWLIHTLAHVLMREMAMHCGYSAASLSERLYAWDASDGRDPSAGMLICTTASDSDGTLGGLVQLSEPTRLAQLVDRALKRARRCSSDPVCAKRTPRPPEDFLHGAACHCCAMASETSCERANRFLDRRFLLNLPDTDLGFFA